MPRPAKSAPSPKEPHRRSCACPALRVSDITIAESAAGPAPISTTRDRTSRLCWRPDVWGCTYYRQHEPDPASDVLIGKRRAATPEFSEKVILFYGRYRRRKFWLLSLALPPLLIFILPPLASMSDPKGGGGLAARS